LFPQLSLDLCLKWSFLFFSLVRFYPLNIKSEENIADILLLIESTLQCSEEADVKTRDFEEPDPDDVDPDPLQDNVRD